MKHIDTLYVSESVYGEVVNTFDTNDLTSEQLARFEEYERFIAESIEVGNKTFVDDTEVIIGKCDITDQKDCFVIPILVLE